MNEKLQKVLDRSLERLVAELDVSVTILSKLVTRGIIRADQKNMIEVSRQYFVYNPCLNEYILYTFSVSMFQIISKLIHFL